MANPKTKTVKSSVKKVANFNTSAVDLEIVPSRTEIKVVKDKTSPGGKKLVLTPKKADPLSDPYVICIKNASDSSQTVRIFQENAIDLVNHPYVHVYSRDPNQSYDQILTELRKKDVAIGLTYINKNDLSKQLPFILKLKIKIGKFIRSVVYKITMDPYQQQTSVITFKTDFGYPEGRKLILSKNSWLEVSLEANGILHLSFYPMSKETTKKS